VSLPRYAARRDDHEPLIIKALEDCGCSVEKLSQRGVPDLLVGVATQHGRRNLLIEIKRPRGRLTADQVEWRARWRGQYVVVRTVDEALRAVGVI